LVGKNASILYQVYMQEVNWTFLLYFVTSSISENKLHHCGIR